MNIGQLRWRCRRGMKELDVLLVRYLDHCHPHAPASEQQTFENLLELPDTELYEFLIGKKNPPHQAMQVLVEKIRIV